MIVCEPLIRVHIDSVRIMDHGNWGEIHIVRARASEIAGWRRVAAPETVPSMCMNGVMA